MRISIDVECPESIKQAAKVVLPVLFVTTAGLAFGGVPTTFTAGETLKASDLNTDFANLDGRLAPLEAPQGRLSYTNLTSFSLPQGTFVTVPYATKVYDDRSELDPATSAFTAKTAGDYEVCASIVAHQNVNGLELDLYVNGARTRSIAEGIASTYTMASGCTTLRLAASDKVDVRVFQNSPGTITMSDDPTWDWVTIDQRR